MREMKDSGVEWIGEIPKNWKITRLKNLFSFGKGLPITKANLLENGIPVISYGQIHNKKNNGIHIQDFMLRYVSDKYLESNSNSLVHKGDFIFADTSEDIDGCGNCIYVDRDETLFAGYHTIIFKSSNSCDYRFLGYLFQTDVWRWQIRSKLTEVKLYSISRRVLASTSVLMPDSKETQIKIADFLDTKCAKIDAVIARQEAIIEKLKAYKLSVITEAVTKGLDPDVEMKDSGVEWIGEIPKDWKVSRIGNLFSFYSGDSLTSENIEENGRYDVYGANGIRGKYNRFNVSGKHILLGRVGALCGNVHIVEEDVWVTEHALISVELTESTHYKYCAFLFQAMNLGQYSKVSAQPVIASEVIRRLRMPVSSINEQQKIASFLDTKCSKIDADVVRRREMIDKLKAYKKSLIYEVVTGKRAV